MQTFSTRLLTISALASAISDCYAQDNEIYELVTTALHKRSAETALPVTILTGDDLHKAIRATLGDTLASQPGISTASFGPAVGQTVIRGQQGRRVMNLANSIANADASGNSSDHAQTVEPLLATSIEVLRGPATLLYGGGAIGGVVNVIDRRIATNNLEQAEFALETRYDSAANMRSRVASLDFSTNALVWHVDGVKRAWRDLEIPGLAIDPAAIGDHILNNTDGYINNTGGETTNVTGGLSWVFDRGHLGMAYSQIDNGYGLPPGNHGQDHKDFGDTGAVAHDEEQVSIAMENRRYDIDGVWRGIAPWLEELSLKISHIDYQHAELEDLHVVGTRFNNQSWQQRLQLTHKEFGGWHGVFGLQNSLEEFGAVGAESFIPVSDNGSHGLFIVEDFHSDAFTWELGARANRDDYSPLDSLAPSRSFKTHNISASTLWQYSDPFTLGLLFTHAERAPSAEELYSNYGMQEPDDCIIHFASGACEIGNTSFEPERSFNTDLTFSWNLTKFDATLTLFNNDFTDYIAQIATGTLVGDFPVRVYSQENAQFHGIELDMDWQLTELVSLRIFGDAVRGKLDSNDDIPRLPPVRYGAELKFSQGPWNAYLSALHANAQTRSGRLETSSNSWTKIEAGADYTIDLGQNGELLLFAHGRNLGDETIRLATSYLRSFAPEAGRSFETGVRYRY